MKKLFYSSYLILSCANYSFDWDDLTFDEAVVDYNKPIMLYFMQLGEVHVKCWKHQHSKIKKLLI